MRLSTSVRTLVSHSGSAFCEQPHHILSLFSYYISDPSLTGFQACFVYPGYWFPVILTHWIYLSLFNHVSLNFVLHVLSWTKILRSNKSFFHNTASALKFLRKFQDQKELPHFLPLASISSFTFMSLNHIFTFFPLTMPGKGIFPQNEVLSNKRSFHKWTWAPSAL